MLLASRALAAPGSLSVCQAVQARDQLDGKIVRIRGVWREAFPDSGLFDELIDGRCPGAEILVVTTVASLPHPPPAGYRIDMKSAIRAQRVAEKALVDGRDLSATIIGVLYLQKKEDYVPARPLSVGVAVPPHHKWYPLVLLVESVPDVKER